MKPFILIFFTVFSVSTFSADVVPYMVQSISSKTSGYVELIGPGKMQIEDVNLDYAGTKYIKVSNIGTLTSVNGISKGCILAYSSEGYTENISVLKQSCSEVLSIIIKTNKI